MFSFWFGGSFCSSTGGQVIIGYINMRTVYACLFVCECVCVCVLAMS